MDSPDHLKIWIKKGMDNWKGKKNALDPKFSLIMHKKKKKRGGKTHTWKHQQMKTKNITFYMFIDYITLSHLALISCGLMVV